MEDLKIAKEKAESTNMAKSDFLMNMSHELRTPLNGVLTASELITSAHTQEELAALQKTILSSGQVLLRTFETILDYTRSKDGTLELAEAPFDLHRMLAKIRRQFVFKGKPVNLRLVVENVDPKIPNTVIGDETRLIEVFNHLIENAAKFNMHSPVVKLSIRRIEHSLQQVVLEFLLSDNGIGIDPNHLNAIFEPFFQVDATSERQYDGVGIGLAVCKQLIKLMGGTIGVAIQLNQGSTFTFSVCLNVGDNAGFLTANLLSSKGAESDSTSTSAATQIDFPMIMPIIISLKQALHDADPLSIQTTMTQLSTYHALGLNPLAVMIKNYEYDKALELIEAWELSCKL